MADDYPLVRLSIGKLNTQWAARPWPDFGPSPTGGSERLAVLPLCGLCAWSSDLPLDSEELVALSVLDAALETQIIPESDIRVLPPLRFVQAGPMPSPFSLDPETAHAMLEEILEGVRAAGARRVVLYNSSPWNEEFIDVAARDSRISLGLQMFCINLSGLGLDFNSERGGDGGPELIGLLETIMREETDRREALLEKPVRILRGLFAEILTREALPNDGKPTRKEGISS